MKPVGDWVSFRIGPFSILKVAFKKWGFKVRFHRDWFRK